ncbi:DNA-3-methyladenine glycosylase [Achromobacter spanius]|nr:DNA-3-methyladenine glycosylase [Achromobacter spanius]
MLARMGSQIKGPTMLRDELLAKMIAHAAPGQNFDDWAEVLTEYANCLVEISDRLSVDECTRLVNVGSMFYRTLARAEDYRRTSVRGD